MTAEIVVRRATPDDDRAILGLAVAALGWEDDDRQAAFFTWKHRENPFGASPAWLATADDQVVAFRTFLRWELRRADGSIARAVRAVDTATHPDFQGQGLFTRLTLGALDDLTAEGVDFVFNTPNDRSRPGYLKMGWKVIGRPPVRARPSGVRALTRLVRARAPALKWSLPATFGEEPALALADGDGLAAALDAGSRDRIATNRSVEHLRWRYGFAPLHYRVIRRGDHLADGFAVVRLRRRGPAVEGAVCELVLPDRDKRVAAELLGKVEGADYLLAAGDAPLPRGRFLPVPHGGPMVTGRTLSDTPPVAIGDWSLTLGDLELL